MSWHKHSVHCRNKFQCRCLGWPRLWAMELRNELQWLCLDGRKWPGWSSLCWHKRRVHWLFPLIRWCWGRTKLLLELSQLRQSRYPKQDPHTWALLASGSSKHMTEVLLTCSTKNASSMECTLIIWVLQVKVKAFWFAVVKRTERMYYNSTGGIVNVCCIYPEGSSQFECWCCSLFCVLRSIDAYPRHRVFNKYEAQWTDL